jgi:hypothetical protein
MWLSIATKHEELQILNSVQNTHVERGRTKDGSDPRVFLCASFTCTYSTSRPRAAASIRRQQAHQKWCEMEKEGIRVLSVLV